MHIAKVKRHSISGFSNDQPYVPQFWEIDTSSCECMRWNCDKDRKKKEKFHISIQRKKIYQIISFQLCDKSHPISTSTTTNNKKRMLLHVYIVAVAFDCQCSMRLIYQFSMTSIYSESPSISVTQHTVVACM